MKEYLTKDGSQFTIQKPTAANAAGIIEYGNVLKNGWWLFEKDCVNGIVNQKRKRALLESNLSAIWLTHER